MLNTSWQLGKLTLPNRLIQGPLAGVSCASFRRLFYQFTPPAYCVSEMLSARDVVNKHKPQGRYLFRAAEESILCYQIAGTEPNLMAEAAVKLEALGGQIIDINCGCPKPKIRKKGAGSALLEQPQQLLTIIRTIKSRINCPLTIKIRLQGDNKDLALARQIADAGADALIIHGRRWQDDYTIPSDLHQIAFIKQHITIPVIVNGDIACRTTLNQAVTQTNADAYMISRAGSGKPWLYEELLSGRSVATREQSKALFLNHLHHLAALENDYQAILQSKSLVKYYFRPYLNGERLQQYYRLDTLKAIDDWVNRIR